jgi:hypothetical protein
MTATFVAHVGQQAMTSAGGRAMKIEMLVLAIGRDRTPRVATRSQPAAVGRPAVE